MAARGWDVGSRMRHQLKMVAHGWGHDDRALMTAMQGQGHWDGDARERGGDSSY